MNLFRSEEHARRWSGYNPQFAWMLKPLAFWAEVFSGSIFRNRTSAAYISWLKSDDGKAGTQALMAKLASP